MNKQKMKTTTVIALLSFLLPAAGWAFEGQQGGGRHQGPPQMAIDACKDKNVGDEVEVTNRQGQLLKATCQTDQSNQLVAMPADRGENQANMVKVLGLTAEQQQQIKSIRELERSSSEPLLQQLAVIMEQIKTAIKTEPFDEAAVRALAASQEEIRIELTVGHARMRNQIFVLLTPAQRDLEEKFLSAEGARHDCHLPPPGLDF